MNLGFVLVKKVFVTVIALDTSNSGMGRVDVSFQMFRSRKANTTMRTQMRPVTSVKIHVLTEVVCILKGPFTHWTGEWFLSRSRALAFDVNF